MLRRTLLPMLHTFAVAAVLVWLVYWNCHASDRNGKRLVWSIRPKAPIYAGELIQKDRLEGGFTYVQGDGKWADTVSETAGRYGSTTLKGDTIDPEKLSFNLIVPPVEPGSIIAIIEVPSNHTAVLKPGMLLAFARLEDKQERIYPSVRQIRSGKPPPLRLLGITPKGNDVTSLVVEIPPCATQMAPSLANGQWRPIVLPLK
jgi:hypothetical protein